MQFNTAQRELTLKVVYYGPALSGKTTNLEALHALMNPGSRGDLTTLDTKGDRTLFFDLLPIQFRSRSGVKIKVKLFTVPGQVIHESTRRIVLSGTDAIVFVADSDRKSTQANNEAFGNMMKNLEANGLNPNRVPCVIQFNKRDLPDAKTDAELQEIAKRGREPIYPAVAIRGEGVAETLRGILELLYRSLDKEHEFSKKFGITEHEFMTSVLSALEGQGAGEDSKEAGR